MRFNKSIVATFVAASLTTVTLSTVAASNSSSKNVLAAKQLIQQNKNVKDNVATINGMRNQFDNQLKQTTFQWADAKQARPNLTAIASEHQVSYAADFYLNRLTGLSSAKSGVAKPILAKTHNIGRGAVIAKYKQEVAGVEVFNREFNVMMDRELNLVASSGYFANKQSIQKIPAAIKNISAAFGEPSAAINAAFASTGGDTRTIKLSAKESNGNYQNFTVANLSEGKTIVGQPRAKQVFFEHKDALVAAHYVEIETSSVDSVESEYFSYIVSAKTGEILFKNNLTSHAEDYNYRIYADETGKPWDSPHGNVIPAPAGSDVDAYLTAEYKMAPMVTQSHGPISTMDAWLADGATETSGNNVTAYVDTLPPQGLTDGDYMADITSTNTFDYKYDVMLPEYSMNNRKAAIVNLFYLNNYLHDDYYGHGFDEVSGNAQEMNYERGGEEGDSLNVEVQDNSGFNNANMSTPADGESPRMQMYLYDTTPFINGEDYGVNITSHADIGYLPTIQVSSFGAENFSISGEVVRIDDETDVITDGCETAANAADLEGKIAIIDRGACNFTLKVKNAQDAGAIAVLIANNNDDGTAAPMGGGDDTVTIPNMGIDFSGGAQIYAQLDANETVTIDMFVNQLNRTFKGSSWDNGTVTHEWGHYISNRLVGNSAGLSNQQGRSMGEGFGDFHALLLLSAEEDAMVAGNEMYGGGYSDSTYTGSFVTGIRPYPYSTDMEINPSTFGDVGLYPDEVHSPGSIWGNMLWESYVGLINDERHTFAEANSLMKDYLVAGYKMIPMAPTFTEARDAILAAAYANDIKDYDVLLAAFAKRGMGLGATSPSRYDKNHTGVVESYKTELATVYVTEHDLNVNYEGLTSGYCSNDNILDKGETGTVSFTVKNVGSEALTGVMGTIEVTSGHDVTFANEGMITLGDVALSGSATSSPIEFTLNEAGTGEEVTFKLSFPDLDTVENVEDYTLSTTVNVDFVERKLVEYSQYEDLNTLSRLNDFTETVMTGGDAAMGTFSLAQWDEADGFIYAANNPFTSDVTYETRDMTVGYFGNFSISFYTYYDIEEGYDGGVVEISVNGSDWVDVTEAGGTFEGNNGWEGNGYLQEAEVLGRLAYTGRNSANEVINFGEALNGNDVKVRFRMVSDANSNEDGWYIDDMVFTNIQNSIFTDVVAGDTYACDNRLPLVSVSDDLTVNEGTSVDLSVEANDPNSDELTYSWAQVSGTSAAITGGDTSAISFTAPSLASGSDTLVFEVSVNDGKDTVMNTVSVTVNDIPAPTPVTPTKTKKSGGGSTGFLALLLLPLALLRRRK
jgi:hypothetical protein